MKTTDVRMGNGTRGGMRILVFLPDHFLYRGVVRTVVHVLGSAGGSRKQKRQITGQSLAGRGH